MPRLEWWFLVHQRCGSKSSYNGSAIRFVSCDDDCLDPFGTVECGESFEESPVSGDGDEVCFGSGNQETNRIDFGSKMATNVELFSVPSDEDSNVVQSAYIHTSCSKPVYPNWATVFAQDCSSSDSRLWSISTMLRRPVLLVSMWHSLTASVQDVIKLQINSTMRPESYTLMSTWPIVDATAMRRVHPRFLPRRHGVSNMHSCPCLHFVIYLIVSHFSLVCYSSCSP
jgi:hypothetical protein